MKVVIRNIKEYDASIFVNGSEVSKVFFDDEILDISLKVKFNGLTGVEMVESNGKRWTFCNNPKNLNIFEETFYNKCYILHFSSLKNEVKKGHDDVQESYEALIKKLT